MSFDFFNTSHLAFGSKLTKAFIQLDRLCTEAEENQENLNTILEQYTQYFNRNYKAPFPSRPDAPCRTNEIFDIINDLNSIKYLRLNEEGNLECAINLFKRASNRFTVASGTTTLKKGYASVIDSISNARPERDIQFTEEYPSSGNFLFEFRIDGDNINIIGDSKSYFLPGDFNHIIGMQYERTVSTSSYTAEENECIVCVGKGGVGADTIYNLTVKINGNTKLNINAKNMKNFGVVYLKPGDVLTGNMSTAFKVKYTQKEVPIPEETTSSVEIYRAYNNISYSSLTAETICDGANKLSDSDTATILETGAASCEALTGTGGGNCTLAFKLPQASDGNRAISCTYTASSTLGDTYAQSGRLFALKSEGGTPYTIVTLTDTDGGSSYLRYYIPSGYDIVAFWASHTSYVGGITSNFNIDITNLNLNSEAYGS